VRDQVSYPHKTYNSRVKQHHSWFRKIVTRWHLFGFLLFVNIMPRRWVESLKHFKRNNCLMTLKGLKDTSLPKSFWRFWSLLVFKPAILPAHSVTKCGNIKLWFTSYPTTSPYVADISSMNQTVQFQKVYHNAKLNDPHSSTLISSILYFSILLHDILTIYVSFLHL
jgi:hypothetical protein